MAVPLAGSHLPPEVLRLGLGRTALAVVAPNTHPLRQTLLTLSWGHWQVNREGQGAEGDAKDISSAGLQRLGQPRKRLAKTEVQTGCGQPDGGAGLCLGRPSERRNASEEKVKQQQSPTALFKNLKSHTARLGLYSDYTLGRDA